MAIGQEMVVTSQSSIINRSSSTAQPCALLMLTLDELRLATATRASRHERNIITKNPGYAAKSLSHNASATMTIWDFEEFLSHREWRLLYRIIELGGSIGIYCEPLPEMHHDGITLPYRPNSRLRLIPEFLPKALTQVHIDETCDPVPNEGNPK